MPLSGVIRHLWGPVRTLLLRGPKHSAGLGENSRQFSLGSLRLLPLELALVQGTRSNGAPGNKGDDQWLVLRVPSGSMFVAGSGGGYLHSSSSTALSCWSHFAPRLGLRS